MITSLIQEVIARKAVKARVGWVERSDTHRYHKAYIVTQALMTKHRRNYIRGGNFTEKVMMKLYVSFLLIFSVSTPAWPFQCNVLDAKNFIAFGRADVGDDMKQLGHSVLIKGCSREESPGYFDCEAIDENGVAYLIEGTKIIRKRIVNLKNYRGRLPFNIQSRDNLYTVLVKAKSIKPSFPTWIAGLNNSDLIILETDYCFKNQSGDLSNFYLGFDKTGHLQEIGSRLNWN